MSDLRGDDLDSLRQAMRNHLRAHPDAGVTLTPVQLRLLAEELGRLQQSNDRLRRQNRRTRLKLQGHGDLEVDAAGVVEEHKDEAP
ncbi:MAG TPA: hypothetical protein VK348_01085 [Planctomycetota bacterium]|nr:hypothetical protein [Planctomycetota bacterium]